MLVSIIGEHATDHHHNIHTVMLCTRLLVRVRIAFKVQYLRSFLGPSAVAKSTGIVGNKMNAQDSFVSTETLLSLDPSPREGDIARR